MTVEQDRQNLSMSDKKLYWKGDTVGIEIEGSVSIALKNTAITYDDVAGYIGVFKEIDSGQGATIKATIYTERMRELIAKMLEGRVDIDNDVIHLGNGIFRSDEDFTGILQVHDRNDPGMSDLSDDAYFYKAKMNVDWSLVFGTQVKRKIDVTFEAMPDVSKPFGKNIGMIGDWAAYQVSSDPIGIVVTMDKICRAPYLSMNALTMIAGQQDRLNSFRVDGAESAITLKVNNIAGYTDAATSVIFDTLSSPRGIAIGDVIRHGTGGTKQYAYVSGITYTSNSAGTMTLVRKSVHGNTEALVDDDNMYVIKSASIYITNVRDSATHASATPADVTIGNTFGSTVEASKPGVITYVSSGSSVITVTVGTIVSPDLTITTT